MTFFEKANKQIDEVEALANKVLFENKQSACFEIKSKCLELRQLLQEMSVAKACEECEDE